MKKIALLSLAALTLSSCAGVPASYVPPAVYAGYAADIGINSARGGTFGKTISGDTARAAEAGSQIAHEACGLYDMLVSIYDVFLLNPFTTIPMMYEIGIETHCGRINFMETADLKAYKALWSGGADVKAYYCADSVKIKGKAQFCADLEA